MKKVIILLTVLVILYTVYRINFDEPKNKKKMDADVLIKIVREKFTDLSTIGKMYVNGQFFCYTLEDKVREKKIKGITAIPKGIYEVIFNYSERFKKIMPLLLGVPNFDGIRIHSGNTDKNTDGCILVGYTKGSDYVGDSRKAYDDLVKQVKGKKIKIEITNQVT